MERAPDLAGVEQLELFPSRSRREEFTGTRNAAELVDPQRSQRPSVCLCELVGNDYRLVERLCEGLYTFHDVQQAARQRAV